MFIILLELMMGDQQLFPQDKRSTLLLYEQVWAGLIQEPLCISSFLMKINGIVKNLREIMSEIFLCFVFLALAFDKKNFKCNAGKTQLLPYL